MAKMFTSLVLIVIVASPLIHLFQALPALAAAQGCFQRIQAFLELEEKPCQRFRPSKSGQDAAFHEKTRAPRLSVNNPQRQNDIQNSTPSLILSIKDAEFRWSDSSPSLKVLDFSVNKGEHVAIFGKVGCGKTLLLEGLLGEAQQLRGSTEIQTSSIAYCSQKPWLENLSAEQNWTQYTLNDHSWYGQVIHACALRDVVNLPDYSKGTVGSGGARLSGGQRQRIVSICSIPTLLVFAQLMKNRLWLAPLLWIKISYF
jgi:ABC-type bacteriocin/lantibiotic exporter with double-glycine peptidase domain